MSDPLQQLLSDGIIEAVVARLKSGKEADIWLVQHAGEVVAAKVYKDLHARSFHNNSAYKEGRQVRDSRTQRAMVRGSRFGQRAAEEAWKAKESEALHALHAAGVRVPRPVMFYEGVLLMEAVVDAEGHAAPRLIEAAIPPGRAAEWYVDLRQQVVRMLSCDLIHGDLSPYNVLMAWNGPTVIDFPQVVGAAHNSQAERFFLRDLETIQGFFAPHDPAVKAAVGDAREIWRAYVRRELTPDFVPTGKAPPEPARGHGHGERGEQRRQRGEQRGPPEQRRQRGEQHAPAEQRGEQHGRGDAQHSPRQPAPPSPPRGEGRGGAPKSNPPPHQPAPPEQRRQRAEQHGRGDAQHSPRHSAPPSAPRGEGPGGAPTSTPPPPHHRGERHPQPRASAGPPHRGPPQDQRRSEHPPRQSAPPSPPRGEGRGGAPRSNPPPRSPRRDAPGPVVTYVNRPSLLAANPASPARPAPHPHASPPRLEGTAPDAAPPGHRRRRRRRH